LSRFLPSMVDTILLSQWAPFLQLKVSGTLWWPQTTCSSLIKSTKLYTWQSSKRFHD